LKRNSSYTLSFITYKHPLIFCIYNIEYKNKAKKYHNNACQLFNLMLLEMAIALKHTEAKKSVSMTTTTIAIAILATALAFPTMTTVSFAQSSGNDFQEFTECLFNDVGGSSATAQDVEDVLQGNSADVTEQEIRDCFSPIYNEGSGDSTGSSSSYNDDDEDSSSDYDDNNDRDGTSNSNNNSDDEEDSTEETDSTDNTDSTEGDDTTDSTDSTDTSGDNEDTTSGNTEDPESSN
jgi:hypothetical protein